MYDANSSGVPFYLQANVENSPSSTDIFKFNISTTVPQNVNWNPPVNSVWETVSDSIETTSGVLVKAHDQFKENLKSNFLGVYDLGGQALEKVAGTVTNIGDGILGTLSKYFILIAGVLILVIFVLGKSGIVGDVAKARG